MNKLLALAMLTLLLSACQTGAPPPPLPTGPFLQLNDYGGAWGTWTPTQDEVQALPK